MHLIRAKTFDIHGDEFRVECCKYKDGKFSVVTRINGFAMDRRTFDDYESAWSMYTFLVDFGKDVMCSIPESFKES